MNKKPVRIKYVDIVRTMSELLYDKFPDIEVMDVIKDHPRPAFFTRLDVNSTGRFMTRHIDTEVAFRIYYYPSTPDNNEVELLQMQEELEFYFIAELESLININGVNIEILDLGIGTVDKVLHFYIFMTISQELYDDSDDIEMMEDLDYTSEVYYDKYPKKE